MSKKYIIRFKGVLTKEQLNEVAESMEVSFDKLGIILLDERFDVFAIETDDIMEVKMRDEQQTIHS